MKRGIVLFLLMVLFILFGTTKVMATERTVITVKSSELNSGVVILDIVKTGKPYELQCNHGASGCAALKSGRYVMVELPKNFGMYDCKDVEIYQEFAINEEQKNRVGEYCLLEKQ